MVFSFLKKKKQVHCTCFDFSDAQLNMSSSRVRCAQQVFQVGAMRLNTILKQICLPVHEQVQYSEQN